MKVFAALLAALSLSGCASLTMWVGAHAKELAAVGLVAGTAAQVGGALVQADEVARRVERRLEEK